MSAIEIQNLYSEIKNDSQLSPAIISPTYSVNQTSSKNVSVHEPSSENERLKIIEEPQQSNDHESFLSNLSCLKGHKLTMKSMNGKQIFCSFCSTEIQNLAEYSGCSTCNEFSICQTCFNNSETSYTESLRRKIMDNNDHAMINLSCYPNYPKSLKCACCGISENDPKLDYYNCFQCNFTLCNECAEKRSKYYEKIKQIQARIGIPSKKAEMWTCKHCTHYSQIVPMCYMCKNPRPVGWSTLDTLLLYVNVILGIVGLVTDILMLYNFYADGNYWYFGICIVARGIATLLLLLMSETLTYKMIFLFGLGNIAFNLIRAKDKLSLYKVMTNKLGRAIMNNLWFNGIFVAFVDSYVSVYSLFYSNQATILISIKYIFFHLLTAYSLTTDTTELCMMPSYNGFKMKRYAFYMMDVLTFPLIWALFSSVTSPYGVWIVPLGIFTAFLLLRIRSERFSMGMLQLILIESILTLPGYNPITQRQFNIDIPHILASKSAYLFTKWTAIIIMVIYLAATNDWNYIATNLNPWLYILMITVLTISALSVLLYMILTFLESRNTKKEAFEFI